jgi:hypothetical protein
LVSCGGVEGDVELSSELSVPLEMSYLVLSSVETIEKTRLPFFAFSLLSTVAVKVNSPTPPLPLCLHAKKEDTNSIFTLFPLRLSRLLRPELNLLNDLLVRLSLLHRHTYVSVASPASRRRTERKKERGKKIRTSKNSGPTASHPRFR